MRLILNILWFVLGGFFMGLSWWLIGCICYLTIVGIPWGKSCFVIGTFSFFPFGKEAISRQELYQEDDIGTGPLGMVGNILWIIFAGIWLAIGHIIAAVTNAITIIGIPFAVQHLKLAGISLAPIGMTVVDKEVAQAAREDNARGYIDQQRYGD